LDWLAGAGCIADNFSRAAEVALDYSVETS